MVLKGLSVITHAVLQRCTQEFVIRLAVAAALQCMAKIDELMEGTHAQSARRFCQRSLLDFFAGVPQFPYASSRFALGTSTSHSDVIDEVRALWAAFTDKWGHDGPPLIQHDLPPVLDALIESSVEVSIMAKGEPLSYQWFRDGVPLEGATLPLLYLSQSIQPHNAGVYSCEVRNQKGRVRSSDMDVRVVDDRIQLDPTKAFRVDKRDLGSPYDAWRNVKAVAGAFVRHPVTGVTVLLPPQFFACRDAHGDDVSNSLGVDIAIQLSTAWGRTGTEKPALRLPSGDELISSVVDVMPHTMGRLLRPATICVPHNLAVDDRFYRPVVVEIDAATGSCKDVSSLPTGSSETTCASVRIARLGRFAVVARRLPGNLELEAPLERLLVILVRPRTVSSALFKASGASTVQVSLWIVRDRPDAVKDWEDNADSLEFGPGARWEAEQFPVRARRGQVVCVQAGAACMAVCHWSPPPLRGADNSSKESDNGAAAIASSIDINVRSVPDDHGCAGWPAFCSMPFSVATRKLTQAISSKNHDILLDPDRVTKNSVLLSEQNWSVLIPLEHDEMVQRPHCKPAIRSRTRSHLVLDLEPTRVTPAPNHRGSESADESASTEIQTPYYFVVELASFSASFWTRYDKTWWFDKTKTTVIDGMYKVVHYGYDRFVTIATSAFAGCIRVAQCSVDHFGAYSEPLLVEPLGCSDEQEPSFSLLPSATGALVPCEGSEELYAMVQRLRELLRSHYADEDMLQRMYGIERDPLRVSAMLDEVRSEVRSANYELSLLLLGMVNLRRQLTKVQVASAWFAKELSCVSILERLVPELDRSPERFASIIGQLHRLVQDAFSLAWELSSDGWLQQCVMQLLFALALAVSVSNSAVHAPGSLVRGEWLDDGVGELQTRVVKLLATDAGVLRGALELSHLLKNQVHGLSDAFSASEKKNIPKVPWTFIMARRYLLLTAGGLAIESQTLEPADQGVTADAISYSLTPNVQGVARTSPDEAEPSDTRVDRRTSELLKEIASPGFREAIRSLQQRDSLSSHLLGISPSDGETCTGIPSRITLFLGDGLVGLSDSGLVHAVKVVNLSREWSNVLGRLEFSAADATLAFVPAVPFEKHCRYRVLVKQQELATSLGATLPTTEQPLAFHFSTPA